jgi:D-beta-D-heptose 7-phosphate kinase/D-beta-D-heptose 1-phosphate adenosyltransferase
MEGEARPHGMERLPAVESLRGTPRGRWPAGGFGYNGGFAMEPPDTGRIAEILSRFARGRFLVLGDVMLDRYWWGDARRLSPEAPVPVVAIQRTSALPGGAANSAANLAGLGGAVALAGIVGDDGAAGELEALCLEAGIDPRGLVREAGRCTTTKTRVIAQHQHVVRVDHEVLSPPSQASLERVFEHYAAALPSTDAVVISDYLKGATPPPFLKRVSGRAREAGKPVLVDPKGRDCTRYAGCTLLKPNRAELSLLTGLAADTREHTIAAGRALSQRLAGAEILVTEGADGMTLFAGGDVVCSQPAQKREVFDVTGAGDTVLAAVAASLAAGASRAEAMYIASHAAALTVSVLGTYVVKLDELRGALEAAGGRRLAR